MRAVRLFVLVTLMLGVASCDGSTDNAPEDELGAIRTDRFLQPPPDAVEVARTETERHDTALVPQYPSVHVMFQSPHEPADVVAYYLQQHGNVLDDLPDVEPPAFTYTKYNGFDGTTSRTVFVSGQEEPPPADFEVTLRPGMRSWVRIEVSHPGEA